MTLAAKDELFANWLLETGATAAVVRPDRYVYGVAGSAPDLAGSSACWAVRCSVEPLNVRVPACCPGPGYDGISRLNALAITASGQTLARSVRRVTGLMAVSVLV